jgi:hypothetical protein
MSDRYSIPIEGLPEGLEPVRFGVPRQGDRIWEGSVRTVYNPSFPQLIVGLRHGYELAYDVTRDQFEVVKEPPPFPRPASGDWLDFAQEMLAKLVTVQAQYRPELFPQYYVNDKERPRWIHRATHDPIEFRDATPEHAAGCVGRAMQQIANQINSTAKGSMLYTGELPVPQGILMARMEVRRGIAMRYVAARDLKSGWVMRFDVFYQFQPKDSQS